MLEALTPDELINSSGQHIQDIIFGQISVSPVISAVMDTREFHRLKRIKQLGICNEVYPNAIHSRWNHSLGCMEIATQFMNSLERNIHQAVPFEVRPTIIDKACVILAATCHDLGHTTLSHQMEKSNLFGISVPHEWISLSVLNRLVLTSKSVQQVFDAMGITWRSAFCFNNELTVPTLIVAPEHFVRDDLHFIKELILGCQEEAPPGWLWTGRDKKHYLYQIVANKDYDFDIDKFEYILRDAFMTTAQGFGLADMRRIVNNATIMRVDCNDDKTRYSIAYRKSKTFYQFVKLTQARFMLYSQVYFHRTCIALSHQRIDMYREAAELLHVGGMPFIQSRTYLDGFLAVTDFIEGDVDHLTTRTEPGAIKAVELQQRFSRGIFTANGKWSRASYKGFDLAKLNHEVWHKNKQLDHEAKGRVAVMMANDEDLRDIEYTWCITRFTGSNTDYPLLSVPFYDDAHVGCYFITDQHELMRENVPCYISIYPNLIRKTELTYENSEVIMKGDAKMVSLINKVCAEITSEQLAKTIAKAGKQVEARSMIPSPAVNVRSIMLM